VRRAPAILAAATALVLIPATGATPENRVVIRGAGSGTHLRLSVSGDTLYVTGPMAGLSRDCRFLRGHGEARCSLRDAGAIEVITGPSDDKVEVLERLPLPLTAYLGAGSDKLIGKGERDTCYPQASRRNRCIGGGGRDICISGRRNTDCVGGRGNDYCRTRGGSDGCWGGPGRDVCRMGAGEDGCHGDAGDDRLYGGPGADQLYGGRGRDYCQGLPGVGRRHGCEVVPRRER